MIVKVIRGTWTVWIQETKQLNIELEDGRILGVRQMEDDNGAESYFQLKEAGEEIYRKGGWKKLDEVEWKDQEEKEMGEKIAYNLFYGDFEDGQIIDTDSLESLDDFA
jgi:hypothetical protein